MSRLTPPARVWWQIQRERAALVVFWLASGCLLTEEQIAERLDLTVEVAGALLDQLSEIVPITTDRLGRWRLK